MTNADPDVPDERENPATGPFPAMPPPPPAQLGYGPSPPYGGYWSPVPPAWHGSYPRPQATNAMAIVSLVLALVGCLCIPLSITGAILGHVARQRILGTGERGKELALAGIIVGWTVTGLYAIYVTLAVLAVPADLTGAR